VLAQALLIALAVLLLPLVAPRRIGARGAAVGRAILYFPALGLGYLFIEIALIGEASLYLDDVTTAFALVLSGMLIFSGLGSMAANRLRLRLAWPAIIGILALCLLALPAVILATIGWPLLVRLGLLLVLLAPLSFALGMPFPMGLAEAGKKGHGFLPWAWALNGAFSVIATPLANLIATELGFRFLLAGAACLYGLAWITFPAIAPARIWNGLATAPSAAGSSRGSTRQGAPTTVRRPTG
jgi:hypothetical protein